MIGDGRFPFSETSPSGLRRIECLYKEVLYASSVASWVDIILLVETVAAGPEDLCGIMNAETVKIEYCF